MVMNTMQRRFQSNFFEVNLGDLKIVFALRIFVFQCGSWTEEWLFVFSIKRPKLHHHAKASVVAPAGEQVVFSDEEELIHASPPPVRTKTLLSYLSS